MTRLLIAGVGNIFLGDDAFGVEVARQLAQRSWPSDVVVRDFGIRGFDLAYALENCDAAVLIDATQQGGAPGTLYVLEPTLDADATAAPEAHAMTPRRVLDWLRNEHVPKTLRLVGCEPESFGPEDVGQMGLSASVQAAVGRAVELVSELVTSLLAEERSDA